MNVKDLIIASSGSDEFGRPKCKIGLFHERFNSENPDSPVLVENLFIEKPILNIFLGTDVCIVDFKFKNTADMDLKMMWNMMERFVAATNSIGEEDTEIPSFTVSIIPNEFHGKYSVLGTNMSFHTLQPDGPEAMPTVIRAVFPADCFGCFENDENLISTALMEQEAEREMDNE